MASNRSIIALIEELGIDYDRFRVALDSKPPWGKFVHAFEFITVLAVVEEAWRHELKDQTSRTLSD